ncbi:Activator of basal transcription 1, partial [Gonapodya sp. JEL0774]
MKPEKLRHLLAQHINSGAQGIGRVYLQREGEHVAARRKKYGGSKKKNYTEGWVEFLDKKDAKKVALLLNNQPIGGKKRSFYHDDIWNIRYLSGFKWTDLAAQVAYDKAAREQRLRQEAAQAAREVGEYRERVDKARMLEAIQEKKRVKMIKETAEGRKNDGTPAAGSKPVDSSGAASATEQPDTSLVTVAPRFKRRFKQRKAIENAGSGLFSGVWKGKEVDENVRKVQMSVVKKMFTRPVTTKPPADADLSTRLSINSFTENKLAPESESEPKFHSKTMLGKNSVSPGSDRKKIVVAGDEGVGKTTLLMTASTGKFPTTKYIPSVFSREYAISRSIDGDQVWVTFADMDRPNAEFSGARKSALEDGFSSHTVILCFSIGSRESFLAIDGFWKEFADAWKQSGLPVILAGLKTDTRGSDGAVTAEEAGALAKTIGASQYIECSAKLGEGVSDLIEQAVRAAIPIEDRKKRTGGKVEKGGKCQI